MTDRDKITQFIANHGHQVTDDGDAWYITLAYRSPGEPDGWETVTVHNWQEARTALGY